MILIYLWALQEQLRTVLEVPSVHRCIQQNHTTCDTKKLIPRCYCKIWCQQWKSKLKRLPRYLPEWIRQKSIYLPSYSSSQLRLPPDDPSRRSNIICFLPSISQYLFTYLYSSILIVLLLTSTFFSNLVHPSVSSFFVCSLPNICTITASDSFSPLFSSTFLNDPHHLDLTVLFRTHSAHPMDTPYISECNGFDTFYSSALSSSSSFSTSKRTSFEDHSPPRSSRVHRPARPDLSYIPMPHESFEDSVPIHQLQHILNRVQSRPSTPLSSSPTGQKYRRPSPKPLPYHFFQQYEALVVDLDQRRVKYEENALLRVWRPIGNFFRIFSTSSDPGGDSVNCISS